MNTLDILWLISIFKDELHQIVKDRENANYFVKTKNKS